MTNTTSSHADGSEQIPQLADIRTNANVDLAALSRQSPLLIVFLRHGGCPFCLQTLAEVKSHRQSIEAVGTQIVLIHLMTDAEAKSLFAEYGLDDVARVSDPERTLYEVFRLKRGSMDVVVGPRIWWEGFKTTILQGHFPRIPKGDVRQLPGAFLVSDSRILKAFRAETSAQQPDLEDLSTCPIAAK